MPASMLGFLVYYLNVTYCLKKNEGTYFGFINFWLLHIITKFYLLKQLRLETVVPSVHVKYAPGPYATLGERLAILREWTLFSPED